MQQSMFLNLLLGTSLGISLAIASENDSIKSEQTTVQSQSEIRRPIEQPQLEIEWPRVKAKFNCVQFLLDCQEKHYAFIEQALLENKDENIDILNMSDGKLNELSWNVLFRLKNHYRRIKDHDNYTFAYQSMAKLLLSYGIYPLAWDTAKKQQDFLTALIDKIGHHIAPNCRQETKLRKWFHIYEGMLFVKYAKDFASAERKERHFQNAYNEFLEAINLKTTKTTYYLMAELLLDHGFTPQGLTREQAEALAYSYIRKAQPEENKSSHTGGQNTQPEVPSVVEKHARPPYIRETKYPETRYSSPLAVDGEEASENEGLAVDMDQAPQDPLAEYDYLNLIIPYHLQPEGLEIQSHPINKVGVASKTYKIKGQKFKLQNVSGNGMRCFFNALGVDPQLQIDRMRELKNDPIMRYMIANEIVSAARDPEQIPAQLRQIIDFDSYQREQEELDRLSNERNRLLQIQNPDTQSQDITLLPARYQNLRERDEIALEQLRTRCLSLAAYEAFIQYHIDTQQMMVTLQNVTENGNNNLSSIDAIAYMNKVGIEIYQPNERGKLRLAHRYIPANATNLTRIYHEGIHFQALIPDAGSWGTIPVQEIEPEDNNFFNNFEDYLNMEGISLNDLDPDSTVGMYPEIRALINNAYGEKVEVYLHVTTDRQPIILASWDAEPEIIHFYKVNGQWKKERDQHQEEEGETQSIQIPSARELVRLYPKVETYAGKRTYNNGLVRKILYARLELNMDHRGIQEMVNIERRRISEILIANGVRDHTLLSAEIQEKLMQAFLELHKDWVNNKVSKKQIKETFYQQYRPVYGDKLTLDQIGKFFSNSLGRRKVSVSNDMAAKIVSMYLEKKTFLAMRKETSLHFFGIIEVLSQNINPQDYRDPINLNVAKKALSESQKESLIINAFNSLKAKSSKDPSISNVVKALESHKIGYKTVERILKRKGLVEEKLKSEHLSFENQQEIRDQYERLKASGLSKRQLCKILTAKFNVTENQIANLTRGGYNSEGKKKVRENYQRVIAAYNELTSEQKESHLLVKHVMEKTGLNENSVRNYLDKAGLVKIKKGTVITKRKIDSVSTDNTSISSPKRKKFSESMDSESESSSSSSTEKEV